MAYKITTDCTKCGACEPLCPSQAIYKELASYEELSFYTVIPEKCTECVGDFEYPQCVEICPVDACIYDKDWEDLKEMLAMGKRAIPVDADMSDEDWEDPKKFLARLKVDKLVDANIPDYEGAKKALKSKLAELVTIDIPSRLDYNEKYTVAAKASNPFDGEIRDIVVDFGEAETYFQLSEKSLRFPPLRPGKILIREIEMVPLFIGEVEFEAKISCSLGSHSHRISLNVVKSNLKREWIEKLDQWEAEGYDVSEFKDKWFKKS